MRVSMVDAVVCTYDPFVVAPWYVVSHFSFTLPVPARQSVGPQKESAVAFTSEAPWKMDAPVSKVAALSREHERE